MARRLDIGMSDLEVLYRYKNNSFWFDYAFVDKNGHTTDKMYQKNGRCSNTTLAIALDGLRAILRPTKAEPLTIKEVKERVRQAITRMDRAYSIAE